MDGSRFDAWTRRQFGLAVGGVATSLAGLASLAETAAKKKRRKKRCKKIGKTCSPNGRKCCKKLTCREKGEIDPQFRCCKPDGQPCTSQEECCSGCNPETDRCELP
ncbi:MAG: hypothetical protein ACRDJC_24215 [Thermomicrobiales bacterium]